MGFDQCIYSEDKIFSERWCRDYTLHDWMCKLGGYDPTIYDKPVKLTLENIKELATDILFNDLYDDTGLGETTLIFCYHILCYYNSDEIFYYCASN